MGAILAGGDGTSAGQRADGRRDLWPGMRVHGIVPCVETAVAAVARPRTERRDAVRLMQWPARSAGVPGSPDDLPTGYFCPASAAR